MRIPVLHQGCAENVANMMNGSLRVFTFSALGPTFVLMLVVSVAGVARAESAALVEKVAELKQTFDPALKGWRTLLGDPKSAASVGFDDAGWTVVDPGYRWIGPDTIRWFRKRIVAPQNVEGAAVEGARLTLRIGIDNGGIIFVNGRKQNEFKWDEGVVELSPSAKPGQQFEIAVRGYNGPGSGGLLRAELLNGRVDKLRKPLAALLESFEGAVGVRVTKPIRAEWNRALGRSIDSLRIDQLAAGNMQAFETSLAQAKNEFGSAVETWGGQILTELNYVDRLLVQLNERLKSQPDDYLDVDLIVGEQFREFSRQDVAAHTLRKMQRAAWTVDWLKAALSRAISSPVDTENQPVPRHVTGPVEIRNGVFYQGDRPHFFVGMGHFDQVRRDVPIFQRYGFNIIQITISPGSVVRSDSEYSDESIDRLVEVLDRAAQHHVAVDLLIAPHGFPGWALKKYPQVRLEGVSQTPFLNYKIDHPISRRVIARYIERVAARVVGHPALFSYCVTNEPEFVDRSRFSQQRFQEWLREQHEIVETLNQRYTSSFATFSEIPIPGDGTLRGLWYDWCRFNQSRLVEFHQFLIEGIRKHDAKTPVHAKAQARVFDRSEQFENGPDPEPFAKLGSISGNDCWSYYRSHQREQYAAHFLRQAMYYDLQRAVAPDNPVFNSENHPLEDDAIDYVPGRHLRTLYWNGAIHGMGATTTWVWTRSDGQTLGGNILKRVNCVRALGRTALDMNRLAPEIVKLQRAAPGAALLFARASMPISDDTINEMKSAYEGCFFLDAPVTFVTDRQMTAGRWREHKLIVVPNVTHIEDTVVAAIRDFANSGGTVILTGDSFRFDEYGKSRDRWEALGVSKPAGSSQTYAVGQGRLEWRAGAEGGKTIDVWAHGEPYHVRLSPEEYAALVDPLLDEIGIPRAVRAVDALGKKLPGVELRSVPDGDGLLINLTNYRKHETPVRLIFEPEFSSVTNLFAGRRQTTVFELEPLEPLLLRATP